MASPSHVSLDEPKTTPAIVNEKSPATSDVLPATENTNGQAPPMSVARRRAIVFALCMAVFMSALDITIIATALPTIATQIDATAAQYAWIASSYTLANTAFTPIWVKASDYWGRKSMLLSANVVFCIGSLVSGLSRDVGMLIGGRVVQGLGAGGITILVSVTIGDLFELRDRAKYYGMTGIVYAVASGLGPVLGGVFTETVGWRWCFYINLPLDAISLVLLIFILKLKRHERASVDTFKSIDWMGSLLIVGGTILFLIGLESGNPNSTYSWNSAFVISFITVGVVLMGFFVVYEWFWASNPVLPVKIFGNRTTLATLGVSTCHSFVFIAYDLFLPLYFQIVLGLTPILSGVLLFALVIPMSALAAGSGFFVRKTGNFLGPMRVGLVLMTLGTGLLMLLDTHRSWAKLIIFQLITGIGTGMVFQSPLIALQANLKGSDMAAGTSGQTFLRSLFQSISVVVGTVLVQHGLGGNSFMHQGPSESSGSIPSNNSKEEYVSALKSMWIFYTAICGLGLFCSCLVARRRSNKKVEEQTGNTPNE